jgi:large subunit ribosomal protein L18
MGETMKTLKKRKSQGKTDYRARLLLLKSGKPRITARKTNKYIILSYVESKEARDKVTKSASSKELLKYGWDKEKSGSLKSITSGYLTGLLLAEKIKGKEAVFDIGLNRNVKKSRIYAALKGLVEGGVKINCRKEVFPEEERIKGKHLKNKIDFEKIKQNITK